MVKQKGVKAPQSYDDTTYPMKAYEYCLLGATNKELAELFKVTHQSIEYWIRHKDKFRHAVEAGRTEANAKVAQSLFRRAVGYSHPDEQIISNRVKHYGEDGAIIKEETEALRVPITKHYPPDTKAAQFWLQNRTRHTDQPWVHAMSHEITGKGGGPVEISNVDIDVKDLTIEELKLLETIGLKGKDEKNA